ncbi:F-actin-uncapping protein LRRC16A-like isoform X1 [Haliotis asinina]|uniref:F-actin-uncapping protein LRRC16A-like isoform X1 n=1 Tax=Haliotis asinina TaxID=109174 RepID=UPI0035322CE6
MAALNNIPRDILDSIRDVVDRRMKFSIKRMVRQEVRPEKLENRILAFSPCRLFVLAARVPTKLEQSFHFLDIQAIESRKPNQMTLTVDGKCYTFVTLEPDTEEIDHMITHVGKSLKQIFPSFPLERLIVKLEVTPPERLKTMYDMIKEIEGKEVGPCGGYASMYACMCDYHSLPYREEVAWDVDTIYLSQDSRELCLRDFDHLNGKDLVPIISALEHNCWFTKLNANNVKLTSEAANEILQVMKRNSVIEELGLCNTGIKIDFIQKLSTALLSNSGTQLCRVDLSNNFLEDRGVHHLMGSLSNQAKGLVYLDVSKTGMTTKGLNRIADTMGGSACIPNTLRTLKLAENGQKGEDLTQVFNFLAHPNGLTHLDLSYTDCTLDMLFGALQRGCCTSLIHLNVSHVTFTHKKMKDVQVPTSLKQFFATACMLEHVNLSSTKLPPEAVKELLLGISSNRHIHNLHLDLSSNDLQGQGTHNIAGCISEIKNLASLDISNNGFDSDLKLLLPDIAKCQSLRHLAIGRNFQGVKPKNMLSVLDPVVQLIQEEESSLESLSLADSRLKADTAYVINALGSNTSLTTIDLSGNLMGDIGARMLAKALQINTKLRTILWDKNGTTAQGFEDIAEALEKNFSLHKMPFPVNDASVTMKTQPEKTETALQKIESLLQRNHSPRKCASDQLYRLQQGFLISSTQQMVDRLVVQVQDTVNALSYSPSEHFKEDIELAGRVIKDADNSKQLLPRLQNIAIKSQDPDNPVELKLQEIANNLRREMESQMKKTMVAMLECTTTHCSAVMEDQGFKSSLKETCEEKSNLPRDFTKSVLDGVGTDIFNKLSELNLAVAAHISDQVIEEVIENLSKSHKTLTNHLNLKLSGSYKESPSKSAVKTDTDNEKDEKRTSTVGPCLYTGTNYLHGSPKLTSKRKSLYGRKLRPQSVIASSFRSSSNMKDRERVLKALQMQDIDIGDPKPSSAADDVTAAASADTEDDLPDLNSSVQDGKLGRLEEEVKSKGPAPVAISFDTLDSPDSPHPPPTLQHLSKTRPKRMKNKPPTRPVAPSVLEETETDGVNAFYKSLPASKDSLVSSSGDAPKSRKESTSSPKEEQSKPESKKRTWFSKDKDKSSSKEKDKKEKSSIASGFSNFFHRKTSGGKSADVNGKDKKSESKTDLKADVKPEEPKKVDVLSHSRDKHEPAKPPEVKPEVTKPKETKPEALMPKGQKVETLKPKEPKVDILKPKDPKVEAVKPDDVKETKVEALKPKVQKVEALKPKENTVEALKPKDPKLEALKPNEVKVEETKVEHSDSNVETLKPTEAKLETVKPQETTEAAKPKETKVEPKESKDEKPQPPEEPIPSVKTETVTEPILKPKEMEGANGEKEGTKETKTEEVKTDGAPLAEAEDTKDEEEEPEATHKLPAGIPKIGLGGNLLAEMKQKQEKRLSQRFPPVGPAPAVPAEKGKPETNNNIGEKSDPAKSGDSTEEKRPPSRSATVATKNPIPAPRGLAAKRPTVIASSPTSPADGDGVAKAAARPVPPKKPPQLPPKPRNSLRVAKDSPVEEEGSCESPEKKPEEGVVYDSATLRLTVKQKAMRIHDGTKTPPSVKAKTGSLPRDSDASDDSKDDLKSDSSVLTPDECDSTPGNISSDSQSKELDSKSGEATPDKENGDDSSPVVEKKKGPDGKADPDEIMV